MVLVVEDDKDLLELVSEILEDNGYEVARAENLTQARLNISTKRPDIVVLDATLPDGDGYDFCREISGRIDPAETLPVLLLTGKAGLDQRMKAMLNGARKFLEKPFDIDVLVETVNSMTQVVN